MYRLTSSTAAALLAFGRSVAHRVLRWRDYCRTLNELESLSERDLQDMRLSKADFNAIAWEEAKRRHKSKA
jgi:uncharacterized protein YjiS (DUF1127 family)